MCKCSYSSDTRKYDSSDGLYNLPTLVKVHFIEHICFDNFSPTTKNQISLMATITETKTPRYISGSVTPS